MAAEKQQIYETHWSDISRAISLHGHKLLEADLDVEIRLPAPRTPPPPRDRCHPPDATNALQGPNHLRLQDLRVPQYLKPSIKRIWFYANAPSSCIKYVRELSVAHARRESDGPLPENEIGNRKFNERDKEWEGYNYAYEVLSV